MRKVFNYSNVVMVGGLVFIIFMFIILASESSSNYNLRNKSDALESQIIKLQAQIDDLGYKVTYYKTDSYREILAREKLNMAAPGESVIIIKDEKKPKANDTDTKQVVLRSDQEDLSKKSNFEQWRVFLFGN
jgi:cell division protein FtsB